ncbi:MAG: integration host factor subunit beta [Deltaproteobacteria bacterium]|nr:integration host factor subunit beta [Deltaproteobacteria bacterium]
MTKSGLIQVVATKMPHLSARDVEIVVNTIFDAMTEALNTGDRVEVRGFGSFSVRHRKARRGRNPKTGDAIAVPPKRVPFFVVGAELKDRINEGRIKHPKIKSSRGTAQNSGSASTGTPG